MRKIFCHQTVVDQNLDPNLRLSEVLRYQKCNEMCMWDAKKNLRISLQLLVLALKWCVFSASQTLLHYFKTFSKDMRRFTLRKHISKIMLMNFEYTAVRCLISITFLVIPYLHFVFDCYCSTKYSRCRCSLYYKPC